MKTPLFVSLTTAAASLNPTGQSLSPTALLRGTNVRTTTRMFGEPASSMVAIAFFAGWPRVKQQMPELVVHRDLDAIARTRQFDHPAQERHVSEDLDLCNQRANTGPTLAD